MADTTTQLADDLVTILNGETFSLPFVAKRLRLPRFTLEELKELHVTIVPRGRATEPFTRGSLWKQPTVEIGVQQKVNDVNDPTEGDPISQLVEEIEDYLLTLTIGYFRCKEVKNVLADDSIFAKEHLYDNVFTSVLVATFTD
jgi:hypothetical protein